MDRPGYGSGPYIFSCSHMSINSNPQTVVELWETWKLWLVSIIHKYPGKTLQHPKKKSSTNHCLSIILYPCSCISKPPLNLQQNHPPTFGFFLSHGSIVHQPLSGWWYTYPSEKYAR